VAGAAVGGGLVDGLAEGVGVCDGLGVADGLGVCDGLGVADGLAEGLALVVAEELSVPLAEPVGVGAVVSVRENEGDPAGVVDPEQAETAAEASMVMVPQPITVNIALSPVPAMVVRTFMESPRLSRQVAAPFPRSPASEAASEGKTCRDPVAARAGRRQVPEIADGHKGKAHGRHRHAMT
jgi:hypothetical protein